MKRKLLSMLLMATAAVGAQAQTKMSQRLMERTWLSLRKRRSFLSLSLTLARQPTRRTTPWGNGYAAFSYCERDKDMIRNYIINQKAHHHVHTFHEEYESLLSEWGIDPATDILLRDWRDGLLQRQSMYISNKTLRRMLHKIRTAEMLSQEQWQSFCGV